MSISLDQYRQWLAERHSVRAFTPELVEHGLIKAIFTAAQQAPSNCNSQPWRVWLVRGEACERLRQQLVTAVSQGEIYPQDFTSVENFSGLYRERQIDCARALYDAMGIERTDKPARLDAMLRNYAFFDAPQVLFIGMNKAFGYNNALDVGIYVQSLVLAMHAAGLGACVQGALAHHAPLVRQFVNMPDDVGLLTGISFGYPAPTPANSARTTRANFDEVVTVIE
ncbi:nitroreductase [Simiduia curdlanivorans]|uniref:Nitroreductase n=1 Tax=Simiduia curdlanivorans TaxID=1492769 RepID=A0ABV8V741_9GAMM|nr:nitroreductase [Simiduia curdlanivorans]MDN3638870.1 nitroreductase [Simiduia curdlanivorans]